MVTFRKWAMTCPVADLTGDRLRVISEDIERNDRRAAQGARRYIRGNNLSCLLTFTCQGKFATRDDALAAVAGFMRSRRARRLLLGGVSEPYIYVAEPHKSGGWHVHMGIRERFIPYREVIALWSEHLRRLGHGEGTHRFTVGDPDRGRTHSAKHLSVYMAKYLGKTFGLDGGRDVGARRYSVALGYKPVSDSSIWDSIRAAFGSLPQPRVERWFIPDENGEPHGFWASG